MYKEKSKNEMSCPAENYVGSTHCLSFCPSNISIIKMYLRQPLLFFFSSSAKFEKKFLELYIDKMLSTVHRSSQTGSILSLTLVTSNFPSIKQFLALLVLF